jgi:two-component system sensor histidine kinase QseC
MQVVRSGLRPVERLSEQIAAVGSNDLSARLPNSAVPRELLPIVERLNDLLARVDAAFQRERRFTGDVAHELRTPLAGLRAKLELALSRERSPGSYRQTLTECLQIGWQLQRMTESLLQLARADAGQLDVARDTIDLAQLIRTCWGAFAELARTRDFCIDWDLRAGCCLETDAEKLRVIVHNLLDNAISYTSPSGRIAISAFVADSTAAFNISNTGCSMSPADIPRLFERFWRGAPFSDPGAQTHCGLGLPLCKTLVDRMGGTLEATISKSGVFTAVVRIPARVGQTGH